MAIIAAKTIDESSTSRMLRRMATYIGLLASRASVA